MNCLKLIALLALTACQTNYPFNGYHAASTPSQQYRQQRDIDFGPLIQMNQELFGEQQRPKARQVNCYQRPIYDSMGELMRIDTTCQE